MKKSLPKIQPTRTTRAKRQQLQTKIQQKGWMVLMPGILGQATMIQWLKLHLTPTTAKKKRMTGKRHKKLKTHAQKYLEKNQLKLHQTATAAK